MALDGVRGQNKYHSAPPDSVGDAPYASSGRFGGVALLVALAS